jgi:hypothetical protein
LSDYPNSLNKDTVNSLFTSARYDSDNSKWMHDSALWHKNVAGILVPSGYDNPLPVSVNGSNLIEQKTQADAVGGVLTFLANFGWCEIYNTDATNAGTFIVNGISIHVPAGKAFKSLISGTAGATVTIAGATTYIVSRYV